jgi:tetratricopeptide (TPR) repeat protein
MPNSFQEIEEGGDESIARFEEMLKKKTSAFFDLDVYENIVYHYIDKNELSKAFKACELAQEQYPYSGLPLFLKAQILLQSGNYKEALKYIELTDSYQPNDPEVLVAKANIYAAMGKHKLAIESAEKVLSFGIERDSIHCFIAQNYLKINQYEKSFAHYKQALLLNPEYEDIFDEFMDFIEITAFHTQGIEFFENAIDNDPYSAISWYRLGVVANNKGDYEKALHALDYATIIKEEYPDAWAEMGCVYMNQKSYGEAKKIFEKVLSLEQPSAEIYCHLAASLEKLKDYEQAFKIYRKASDLKENYHEAWFGAGTCLVKMGKHYEAIHFLKRAVKFHKSDGDYWMLLAECEYQIGNVVSCLEAYKEASYYTPYNAVVWLNWSYVFYEQGNTQDAINLLMTGIEDLPDNADLLYRLSAYLISAGKYKQAFGYLENALILNFDKHTVLFDFFESKEIKKALYKIINQFRERDNS